LVLFYQISFAQENEDALIVVPKTPEAFAFDQYLNNPNLSATGTMTVDIPIYTIKLQEFSLPISISYHTSGIRVNQIATPVGLGWSLNAGGVVSRTIYGRADEAGSNGWFKSTYEEANSCKDDQLALFYKGFLDPTPDVFNYHFSNYSGGFFYKKDKTRLKTKNDPVHINHDIYNHIVNITDPYGNNCLFDRTEETNHLLTRKSGGNGGDLSGSGITVIKPSVITTPYDESISFKYDPYHYYTDTYVSSYTKVRSKPLSGDHLSDFYATQSKTEFKSLLITEISSSKERVEFIYEDDPTRAVMKKKLVQIKVTSLIDNSLIKDFRLNYTTKGDAQRFYLESICDVSLDNKTWKFKYNNTLPAMWSHQQDIFGYANQNSVYHMIPVDSSTDDWYELESANRDVSESNVDRGALNSVVYPTGGSMNIEYEAQKEVRHGEDYFGPGVRLQRIYFKDVNGDLEKSMTYEYQHLEGNHIHKKGQFYLYYKVSGDNVANSPLTWSSSPFPSHELEVNMYSGFYYSHVVTNYLNKNGQVEFSSLDNYRGFMENFTLKPYLRKSTSKNGAGIRVKEVDFDYGESDVIALDAHMLDRSYLFKQFYTDCSGTVFVNDPDSEEQFMTHYLELWPIYYYSKSIKKNGKSIKEYDINGVLMSDVNTSFVYNDDYLPVKTSVKNRSLSGEQNLSINRMLYTGEDAGIFYQFNPILNILKTKGIRGKVVNATQSKLIDGVEKLMQATLNEYDSYGKVLNQYQLNLENPILDSDLNTSNWTSYYNLEKSMIYSPSHKLISYSDKLGKKCFFWGYDDNYVVAQIDNMDSHELDQLSNLKNSLQGIDSYSDLSVKVDRDNLKVKNGVIRDQLPSKSRIQTYTFKPFVGVTSQTDINNLSAYYEYDDFNRLIRIRDNDWKLMSERNYNYGTALTMNVSTSTCNFPATSSLSQTINVTSNTNWTIEENLDWLRVDKVVGNGNDSFTITCDPNYSGSVNNGVVTVKAGSIIHTISISQSKVSVSLSANKHSVILESNGGPLTRVDVTSNASWTVSANQSWIKLSKSYGTGNSYFYVSAYVTSATHTGIVTIQAGNKRFEIDVLQKGSSGGGGGPIEDEFPDEL